MNLRLGLLVFCCFILVTSTISVAQTHAIDSLRSRLTLEQDDTNKVKTLNRLCFRFYKQGKNDSSLAYSNRSQQLAEKLGYKKGLAFAQYYAGNIYYNQANYSKALEVEEKLVITYRDIGEITWSAIHTGMIGLIYHDEGDFNKALEYDQKALEAERQVKDTIDVIAQLGNIGNIYNDQGNYAKALEYNFQALELARQKKDKNGIAANLGSIGNIYQSQNSFTQAIDYFNQAIAIQQQIGDKDGTAVNLGNIGNIYETQKKYAEALEYDTKALKIKQDEGEKQGIAINLGNIGNIYSDQRNYTKALEYNTQALAIARQIGDAKGIAINLDNTGGVYLKLQNFKQAKACLDSSLLLAKKMGEKDIIVDIYNNLSVTDSGLGNYKASREDYRMYFAYHDSITSEANSKKTVQTEMNYEFGQKQAAEKAEQDKKDAIAAQQVKRQAIIRNSLIGGFILVLMLTFFIYRSYRQKKDDNVIISHQKEEVDRSQKKVMDSIKYAQKIQYSILPAAEEIKKYVSDYFVCFMPKDIVSGDFYWFHQIEGLSYFAVVDCTGHGVPGACMSMLANSFLNEVVIERKISEPAEILASMHELVYKTLQQQKGDDYSQDGMDISVAVLDRKHNTAKFAGARNNLFITDGEQVTVLKATSKSIGGLSITGVAEPIRKFKSETFDLKQGTMLIMATDGIIDQLNATDEPYEKKRFNALVKSLYSTPSNEAPASITTAINEWKGTMPQLDDVLVMGIRI